MGVGNYPLSMKPLFSARIFFCALSLLLFGTRSADAGVIRYWTNSLGGNWFDPLGWSPNGVPGSADAATITNIGTYTVLVSTGTVATVTITIGGASGKQTLIYGSGAAFTKLSLSNSVVQANGVLVVTNQGLLGAVTIRQGGELRLDSPGMQLYDFSITNQGTLTWSNGSLAVGGSNNQFTYVTNSGLFQITGDTSMNYGGGGRSTLYNAGLIRKINGTGTSTIGGIDLINLPSGTVDVQSGTLQISGIASNELGGSFTATAPGLMKFAGTDTDAGGVASGTGQFQFFNGTFYLRTNTIPNLKFVSGDVYVNGATFQQAGAITNLTMDGANLRGTNRVAGTVTINSGNLLESMTVQPDGQLVLQGSGVQFYGFNLVNRGTVAWSSGSIAFGNTWVSNGGNWTMTGDASINYGGVGSANFTNAGTVQKIAGTGVSSLSGSTFFNQPSGIVSVSTGTLTMPFNYTNAAGELRLNGGILTAGGTLGMTGGFLDGSGTIGTAASFDGGTVSPGPIAGLIQFKSSLTLGTNVTLALDGTGTVPGVSYDQLSVTGAVAISNCTLQVASLPNVPAGTTFVIITNTTANSTTGSFNGLA